MEKQINDEIQSDGTEPFVVDAHSPDDVVETYNPETGKTHKVKASALVGGSGQTIDQYLADTRAGKKDVDFAVDLASKSTHKGVTKTVPPTKLELEIRAETGNMNRAERRAFFAKQSRAVGAVRADMLTLHVRKLPSGVKQYFTKQSERARKSA